MKIYYLIIRENFLKDLLHYHKIWDTTTKCKMTYLVISRWSQPNNRAVKIVQSDGINGTIR